MLRIVKTKKNEVKKTKAEDNETVKEWLSEYAKPNTKNAMRQRLNRFMTWYNKPVEDFLKLTAREAKHAIKKWVAHETAKGTTENTILSIVTAPRSLFEFLDKPIRFRRSELPNPQKGNKHHFSNGDLGRMFDVADLRGKAIIALGSSLGWAVSDVLALDRDNIEALIERAKQSNEKFVFFNRQRGKTGAQALGVLNPNAIEWLSKWLAKWKGSKLFDISHDMINRELRRLTKEAQIKTIGNVTFHCFRAWVFSSLVKSGMSEYEAKLIVGKALPLSDDTYLALEESVKEKYKEKYEEFLNIHKTTIGKKTLALAEENKQQRKMIKVLLEKVENMEKGLTHVTTRLDYIETNVLGITRKRKDS